MDIGSSEADKQSSILDDVKKGQLSPELFKKIFEKFVP